MKLLRIKDVPDYYIFAGAPAKEIGKRSELLEYTLVYFFPSFSNRRMVIL